MQQKVPRYCEGALGPTLETAEPQGKWPGLLRTHIDSEVPGLQPLECL